MSAKVVRLDEHRPERRLDRTVPEAKRPFHVYDARAKKFLRWRFYAHKVRAMRAALWLAKWMPIGMTLEVIDVRDGRLHGQYTRRVAHVEFRGETIARLPKEESHG